MDFTPKPWEVGDLSTIGMLENDLEMRVRDMVNDLRKKYGLCVAADRVTEELVARGIDYPSLPNYMKDIIDELDVY